MIVEKSKTTGRSIHNLILKSCNEKSALLTLYSPFVICRKTTKRQQKQLQEEVEEQQQQQYQRYLHYRSTT